MHILTHARKAFYNLPTTAFGRGREITMPNTLTVILSNTFLHFKQMCLMDQFHYHMFASQLSPVCGEGHMTYLFIQGCQEPN